VILLDLVFAVVSGLVLLILLTLVFRRSGSWSTIVAYFVVISLSAWVGGLWLRPAGPTLFGIYWLTFLFTGAIVTLLIAVLIPPEPLKRRGTEPIEVRVERRKLLGVFFWVLIVLLIFIIVLGYTGR
jgi:hypothetical protein